RRVDFEYLRGDRPFASTYMVYENREIAGSTLRLPARGGGSARAEGVGRVAALGASSTFTIDYSGFDRAGPE
ncbi:hypothetical protein, partial [Longimicrobium sp.]|uniref:hypothetical protein n=1 Tax=Longimicrobium sp. TaxID=2029185 RepID=UPI002F950C6E